MPIVKAVSKLGSSVTDAGKFVKGMKGNGEFSLVWLSRANVFLALICGSVGVTSDGGVKEKAKVDAGVENGSCKVEVACCVDSIRSCVGDSSNFIAGRFNKDFGMFGNLSNEAL